MTGLQERWLWYLLVACCAPFVLAASAGFYYLLARVWMAL